MNPIRLIAVLLLLAALGCDKPATTTGTETKSTPVATTNADSTITAKTILNTTGRIGLNQPYSLGSIRVTLRKAKIGKVPLRHSDGTTSYSEEPRLMLTLQIENLNDKRKAHYETWVPDLDEAKSVGRLTDDAGTHIKRVTLGFGNNVKDRTTTDDINPQKGITDLLLFELPPMNAKVLHLDLPAKNLGLAGTFQFAFPVADIGR